MPMVIVGIFGMIMIAPLIGMYDQALGYVSLATFTAMMFLGGWAELTK